MRIDVGSIVEGKVTGITKFGAFVALPDGKSGLIHISEVANAYVSDIHEYLTDGQKVLVRVLSVGPDGKIKLSAKQVPTENSASAKQKDAVLEKVASHFAVPEQNSAPQTDNRSFEEKLKRFLQESDSKISGSGRYEQQKRNRDRRR